MSDAMSSAIGLFTSSAYDGDGKARYIVLLTDGQGTYRTVYTTKAKDNGIRSKIAAALGSRILNFKLDDKDIAVHSQVDTWQEIWGYNDFYDLVFRTGTNGNMRDEKFQFKGEYID
ncbi:hypothetical protein SAMN05421730_101021 [Anaerobium acetethylicum]|uniref:Uncharacterized protein n=1 Tax=Anaerobium acetethylicum TaxID=1619234 RepID=A0A1D3TTM5_9FIRM|nr:hypothetical protein SAMN05421730_101021 [Anaerobium acetethylicum]